MKKGIIIALSTLILILTGINKVNASEHINAFLPDCENCTQVTTGYRGKTIYDNPGQGYQKLILTTPYNILNNSEKFNFSTYFFSRSAFKYTTYPIEGAQEGVTETNIYLPGNSYTIFIEYINIYNDYMYNSCNVVSNQNNGFANVVCDIPRDAKQIYSFIFYYNTSNPATDLQPIYTGYNRNISFTLKDTTNQTIINNQQQTNEILSGEQNYNKDASEEVNGEEEINDYTEKEEQLFSSLDFEGIGDNEIVINPNTSSFIWEIIDRLRGMNGKIVLLMTSILGLGIIKMVLNR